MAAWAESVPPSGCRKKRTAAHSLVMGDDERMERHVFRFSSSLPYRRLKTHRYCCAVPRAC